MSAPTEAAASFQVPPGFRVQVFASEPEVRQPIAVAWDSRGRLWVAENYTYAEQATGYDLSLRDRIVILEDRDGDGRCDERRVFWDGAQRLTSVEVGFGGVWALCPPHLLFLPDRNHDDVPDGPPEVVLEGWSEQARHNFANGLRWGPDGWLYGRSGILATSEVGPPGSTSDQRIRINCGIWRYHPTRRVVEAVAHGTTNPWGMDWDACGQMFFINTVIGHLWHVIPGAHYQRMYGEDFDPHLYGLLGQTADHYHWNTTEDWSYARTRGVTDATDRAGGGHAHCGMMIYQGDNWPAELRGGLFTINLHGRRLNHDTLERQGATYVGHHAPDFLRVGDPWFRGVELTYGPDGGVYVVDWTDVGECHENDGVHRSSGRIFKVIYGQPGRPTVADVSQLSGEQLVQLQRHPNAWFARQARRVLQERWGNGATAGAEPHSSEQQAVVRQLRDMYASEHSVPLRLNALWCLYGMDALDESWLIAQLEEPDENIRCWAVRLLADRGAPSSEAMERLRRRAEREPSGLVLTFMASALQRFSPSDRWPLARALLAHREFAGDPALPLMVWYGIEPAVWSDPTAAVAAVAATDWPLIRRHIARRLAFELDERVAEVGQLVQLLPAGDTDLRREVLSGMAEALRGRRRSATPVGWPDAAALLARDTDPAVRAATRELSVLFGEGRALDELRALVAARDADAGARRQAIQTLAETRDARAPALLQGLVTDTAVAVAAIRSLAAFDDPRTPRLLIDQFPRLQPPARVEAVQTLVSRAPYARALMEAVADGHIDRSAVAMFQIRQLQLLGDPRIAAQAEHLWPELKPISAAKLTQINSYRERLTAESIASADAARGRAVFDRSCGKCHRLYGSGGQVAPDLTGAQRDNLNYLLENIVDPSATLAANFRMSIIQLNDGRVINGVVGQRTSRTVSVQTPDERMVIPRDEIAAIRESTMSLMPEGQLDVLSEQQVRDLFAYLMSRHQISPPAGDKANRPQ